MALLHFEFAEIGGPDRCGPLPPRKRGLCGPDWAPMPRAVASTDCHERDARREDSFGCAQTGTATVPLQNVTLAEALAEVERRMIAAALRKHNGNISRAARELGLTRRGLYLKLDRLEMTASA